MAGATMTALVISDLARAEVDARIEARAYREVLLVAVEALADAHRLAERQVRMIAHQRDQIRQLLGTFDGDDE